jgi:transposase
MLNNITTHFVGLDAHQAIVAIAVADPGREFPRILPTIPNDFKTLIKVLKKLGDLNRLICRYEAGQTGYGLYRRLKKAGIRNIVIAPYGDRTCIAGGPTTKDACAERTRLGVALGRDDGSDR